MLLRLISIVAAASLALVAGATAVGATGRGIAVAAMPAYIGPSDAQWNTMLGSTGGLPLKVVLDNNNGNSVFDASWQALAHRIHQKGIEVLGYVYTQNGQRSEPAVNASIDNYFPSGARAGDTAPDGILFDQFGTVSNGMENCNGTTYYNDVVGHAYNDIAVSGGKSFVAHIWANPGTAVPTCYLSLPQQIDTFVTAENNETAYNTFIPYNVLNSDGTFGSGSGTYPAWRFAHVVFCAPSTDVHRVVDRAFNNFAGSVYVTSDGCGGDVNPYDNLPSNSYLNDEVTYAGTK
jgi:hypothetical protein